MSKRDGGSSTPDTRLDREILAAFGERVRVLRTAQGLTCERLARKSSLTISSVSRIERGVQEPLLSTVTLLMGALDVTPAELLAGIPAGANRRLGKAKA